METPIVYPGVGCSATRARTIFVGDLSYFCTENDLYRLFASVGRSILNISIARKGEASLMYGFVELDSLEKAEQVSAEFNGQIFMGRKLRIFALSNYTGPASSFPKSNPESFCVHISFVAHNLSEVINEEVLRDLFSTVGEVLDVAIRRYYRQRHRQYGYAFVEFSSKEAALAAANMWKEKDHRGILIKCTIGHRVSGVNSNRSREKDSSHSLLKHKNNAVDGVSGSHHGAAAAPNPVRTPQHPPSQVGHPVQMANHSQHPFSVGNVPNSTTIAPSAGSHYPSQPSVQSTIGNVPSSGHFVPNNNQHAIINNSSGNYLPRETQNAHAVHSFSNSPSATYVLNPTSSPTTLLPVSNSGSYVPMVYGYPQHIPQQHSLPHQTVFVTNPSPYVLHANNHPLLAHPSPAPTVANTVMSTFQPAQVQYVMVPPNQQPFPSGQL